jgi:NAD(P)-dependent dehydrogenase (short-subunit alcohol dehydrogenase family)
MHTQINNAGVVVADISAADHEATLKTNLDGAIDITLALLPHLAQGARVVQVASRESRLRASITWSSCWVSAIPGHGTRSNHQAAAGASLFLLMVSE